MKLSQVLRVGASSSMITTALINAPLASITHISVIRVISLTSARLPVTVKKTIAL